MRSLNIDSIAFETPVLLLLSLLQGEGSHEKNKIPIATDLGPLVLQGADLETRRGMIPLLKFFFHSENGGEWSFYYLGSVSPWKFNRVEFCVPDMPLTSLTFNDTSKRYVSPKSGYGYEFVAGGNELQLACGSIYLWRSCLGLKKIFDKDTGTYFERMQTASRHKWLPVKIEMVNDDLIEEWKTEEPAGAGKNSFITIHMKNGLITGINS